MSSNYFQTTIGAQVTLQRGFDITKKQQIPGDIPVVSSGGIASYHNEAKVDGPGVVLGRKGSLGTVFYLDCPFWPHDTSLWVKDFKGNNPHFVYYFFTSIAEKLKGMDVGAANPALNRNHVHPMEVLWPIRDVQDDIVRIVGILDDKISLNIQTNQTLEQMAQSIFKSWFVDFDPVKAKMNGEQPEGMDAATASLFPEKLVESELGLIPEGWEVKPLDKVAHFQNGLALQKFRSESEEDDFLPVLKIAQLRQGYCDGKEKARSDIKESCRVYDGDMIFSWSGTLMIDLWTGGNAALNQHLFKVTSEEYNLPLYLYWTKHHLAKFQQIAKDKAVTMGHIKRGHLSESLCAIPPKALRDKMDEVLLPLINQGLNLRLQSNQLVTLRDTLLPKLLSGEIELETQEAKGE
ncbi:hypothetical protein CCZ37_08150 [Vibrio qinghaiensis]|uniref:Type I restriction modification DNA specificity domain-containing protein n=1 Tax=Vibrio qinghaiensis TaxID=2025808 RepID=A0A223MYB8_9VIBR|nr:restriction endonuclease subunit S [Vibrio qinghaiensis]ASU22568.1 hypothetical protein CCZ37_08150 [Vibrio qinghaiensis]